MAGEGAFDRVPDWAIFADTRWEPPSVYEHIEWLRDRLSFPLHVVDNGRSLREDVKALTNHSGSRSYVDIPVYLKGRGGEGDGIGRRQCTDNYKIRPMRRRTTEGMSKAEVIRCLKRYVRSRGLLRPTELSPIPQHSLTSIGASGSKQGLIVAGCGKDVGGGRSRG